MAGKNRTRQGNVGCMLGERKGGARETPQSPLEKEAGTLAGKPQPRGDTQITRNGLNKDVRVSQ